MKSVTIIGGGIGGLFSGAFLSKNGCKVTVLEKNTIIGGGLQCFERQGKIYETGMHIMGGFHPGGSLYKICDYLGILDNLNLNFPDPECMDQIYCNEEGKNFKIGSGKENFIKSFLSYFPEDEAEIRNYVDALYHISNEVNLFNLRESPDGLTLHSEQFLWSAGEFIEHYISNPKLRLLLAYLNPLYGGVYEQTPAYIHALINVLYINGSCRFVGGSQQLADALKDVITYNGGRVFNNSEAVEVNVDSKSITSVRDSHGRIFTSDYYISSIHPVELLKIISPGAFPKAYTNRLNTIPNSYSAFSLFIDIKPGKVPYINHTNYYLEDFSRMWTQADYDSETWPSGFMYMTPPDNNQGEYATRLLVHCIMDFEQVKKWEHTTVMHRGAEYLEWKKRHAEKILAKLYRVLPELKGNIANLYSASPLTVRDFYHTKDGAIFGFRKDCRNFVYSQVPIATKVKNLFLTGQNNNLHGICGVPLTAINTAEAIVGSNVIVRAINEHANRILE